MTQSVLQNPDLQAQGLKMITPKDLQKDRKRLNLLKANLLEKQGITNANYTQALAPNQSIQQQQLSYLDKFTIT